MNRQTVARTLAGNPATATRSHTPAGAGRTMSQPAGTSKTRPPVQGGMFRQWAASLPNRKAVDMGGMSRRDWLAANPAQAAQFRDWRRGQMAAMPQGGGRGSEFTNQFISQLPDLMMRDFNANYSGYHPSQIDWNDPGAIRAAAGSLHLATPLSQYHRPGGRRGPITPPSMELGRYSGQLPMSGLPRINWNDGSG